MAVPLAAIWCRSGCSVTAVAASLAFYPPQPPSYQLTRRKDREPGTAAATSGSAGASAVPSAWLSELHLRNDFDLRLEPGVSFVPYDHIYVTEVST